MNPLEGAKCVGHHELFESTDERDHLAARQICAECPVLRDCAALLREVQIATRGTRDAGGGPVGTWAGKLIGKHGYRNGYIPVEHGTDRGYYQHRYRHQEACDPCRRAHSAANRRREVA